MSLHVEDLRSVFSRYYPSYHQFIAKAERNLRVARLSVRLCLHMMCTRARFFVLDLRGSDLFTNKSRARAAGAIIYNVGCWVKLVEKD